MKDLSIYAIADLHLSFNNPKPMDIFGDNWANHENKIKGNWQNTVKDNDTVLIPGDFSWAMTLDEAYKDFEYLNSLPGKKLMLKGNHDYYWESQKKLKEFIDTNNFKSIEFLQNNAYKIEEHIICGTRGWALDKKEDEDIKIINRELIRLELSIKSGIEQYGENIPIIVCMHYPPTNNELLENSEFIKLMQKYNVKKCIYGHLHGEALEKEVIEGKVGKIELELVSSDYLDFKLKKLV